MTTREQVRRDSKAISEYIRQALAEAEAKKGGKR